MIIMDKYREHVNKLSAIYKEAIRSSKGLTNYGENVADILDRTEVCCVWCEAMVPYRSKSHFRRHYAK